MSTLQLKKYTIHSHLFTIQLGDKVIGHVSKIDGGGWMWVRNDLYSIEFATEKACIDNLAADYVETGLDNMAIQHGIITQDEKLVGGFFDKKINKSIRNDYGKK